ncbi:MAG: hypothetical protein AAF511_13075 [Pseudomonadota bacterium]
MISLLLFFAALRIGPRAALGSLTSARRSLATALLYQLILPLAAVGVMLLLGVAATPWALALTLVLAAGPVTGSPNFTILMGRDPSVAMRLLLVGTALFPFTVIPVFWLSPAVDTLLDVLLSALRLAAVLFGAVGIAFAVRHLAWQDVRDDHRSALDGASALLLGLVVIGLMSEAGPALWGRPDTFFFWLAFALILNLGLQTCAARLMPVADENDRPGTSVVAGNRNIGLFLVALPPETIEPLFIFIGVYQIPMYLTPVLMRRITAPRIA